ncbi:MAG TPA: right-handed parallel beta-helix repeat-containing protein, partial [Acetobacteraceae bacterium]
MPATPSDTSVSTPTAASLASAGLHDVTAYVPPSGANILQVGVGQVFTTIASALAAAHDGDIVLVQAGTYVNDFATVSAKVSLIGVGGMVNMVATVPPPNGKAILTVDADATIQNFTFSGAKVPDANGAGIRYEGGNLTLQNCGFHDNENGLLSSPVAGGKLLIQNCDFTHNGAGNGSTHNIYVGAIQQLTIRDSRFSDAVVGHEIKSRAYNTLITGNVISEGSSGNGSYSIDLPNGGKGVVTGNLIVKGPQTENQNIIHFGGESIPYAGSSLLVQGNQITNDRPNAVGVLNQTSLTVSITGNSFTGLDPARIAAGPARIGGNIDSPDADGTGTALPDAVLSGIVPGSVQAFTDALDHQVTLTSSNFAVQGGAGRLQVTAVAGHVVVQGGAGGLDFTEAGGSGGNQVTTAAGSTNSLNLGGQDSIDSEGTDAITTNLGNVTAQIGGAASVNEGQGNNQWSVLGSLHLTGNGGAPRFSLDTAASLSIDGAINFFAIQSSGGAASYDVALGGKHVQASLIGGSWTMQGWDGFTSFVTAAGPDGVMMHLGDGRVQVVSGGADEIWAGSGEVVV